MQILLSKLNIKVGFTLAMSALFAFTLAGAVLPGKTNHTKAEDCSPVYSQPIFNPYPITWSDEAGYNCTDFATLAGGVHGGGTWSDNFNANVGDTVTLRVYVHNGAATNSQQVMHGVQYNVNLDTSAGTTHTVTAQLTASNAAEKDGSITINTPAGSSLQLVSGNLQQYIGDQQPCFDFAQLFYITVKVVGPATVTPPTGQNTITASPGNTCLSTGLLPGTVSWTNSSDVKSIEVTVEDNTANNGVINSVTGSTGAPNSNSTTNYLTPGHTYAFVLYNTTNGQHTLLAQTTEAVPNTNCGGNTPPPVNSTVTLSISNFCVGQAAIYNIQGSSDLANQQIYWSSTLNGSSTGENNANYGQTLNGNASLVVTASRVWATSDIGSWTKTVGVLKNGQAAATSQPFAFTVSNCGGTTPPVVSTVNLSISNFCVGQTPTYVVQGSSDLANQQIYWSSTLNGSSTGENNANYGQTLNSSAYWSGAASRAWLTSDIGSWTKTVGVLKNGQAAATSQPFAFTVSNCGGTTPPTSLSCSANVSSANVGDNVAFTATGGSNGYVWATSNNSNAGTGSVFNVNFASGGNKLISVTSNGQTASCGVFINSSSTATSTGNCNNDSSSCNTNTNNNTQTGSGTNSSNQNNNTNINGNDNTVTNTNNNCVNDSCNNTSTNNYTTTSYTPPVYPVYNYSQPQVYTPPPVYVAATNYAPSVLGSSVNLTYSKSAFNNTKNVDATSVAASREDRITYTLTVSNNGSSPDNDFVITDDLSQVLPYADVVDNGGGYMSGNTISYPAITVPANGSVQESFQVVVKYSLSDSLSYTMVNTYGNTVTININAPQVLGAFTAPRTGADTNAFVFATMLTAASALVIKRKAIGKLIFS